MGRPRKDEAERRVKVSTRLDPDLFAWLKARTGRGKRFKDLAHALDVAIAELKAADEKKT